MAVNTGMTPDDEIVVGDPTAEEAPALPPVEVAGLEPLQAEPTADGVPTIEVRGKQFSLRSSIPGMLLMDLADKQGKMKAGGSADSQGALFAALGRSLTYLVVAEEREDFIEFLISEDPPIDVAELVGDEDSIVARMMEAVTGRPTQSA